eukprot:1913360-Rhodomonas_salina.1
MKKQHMQRLLFRKDTKSQTALQKMRDEHRAARAAAAATAGAQSDLVDEWMSWMNMMVCPATQEVCGGIGTVRMVQRRDGHVLALKTNQDGSEMSEELQYLRMCTGAHNIVQL